MAKGIKTGGRTKGTPNKTTAEIKTLAQRHTVEALEELVRLSKEAENEATRVSAIKEIFDRAYGKAPQAITGDSGGPLTVQILRFSNADSPAT